MSLVRQSQQQITRCAIYTRKSTERGLDMAVTSLEAQREVCRAYIKCQAHRNWVELPILYDDGGHSGGTLERPALQKLIADVEAGRVDIIVIYKIDRLTRSLTDFVHLIDVLNRYGASFVSVTQSFDTSDSMGRLVLNVLLTFAQFERELMSDRVRDKKAAMRRKGIFTGGLPPMGYLIENGRLVVDPERADWVREIFRRYPDISGNQLVNDLRARGCVTRRFISQNGREHGGQPIYNGTLLQILRNPIYAGYIVHRGEWIKAESEALVTREQWDLVQETRSELRLYVSCYELSRYLAWNGVGLFDRSAVEPRQGADRVHVIHAPAFLICGHPIFALPIKPREHAVAFPNPNLVSLLEEAAELRKFVLANRTKSIPQLAKEKRIGQSFFARLLRLNYLAPDIQAAIVDGTQPPGLTRHKMLYSSLPLDWEQQRQLMGFG